MRSVLLMVINNHGEIMHAQLTMVVKEYISRNKNIFQGNIEKHMREVKRHTGTPAIVARINNNYGVYFKTK